MYRGLYARRPRCAWVMRGFWDARSDAQAVEVVMLEAKEDIKGVQVERLAAHVASRVWEMRTRDFEAWKKELEFWMRCQYQLQSGWWNRGRHTWRSSEKGRHDLNVEFVSMASINA